MSPLRHDVASPRPAASRRARGRLGTAALVVLVAAVTGWGLTADRPMEAASGQVEVPGGVLHLDAVRGELLQHDLMPMPGGMMPEMTPDGFARVWVDLTLAATGGEVTWEMEDFVLVGPSMVPVPPRRASVPPVVVPEGHAATFALQFEVPEGSAQGLELQVRGADQRLSLDLDGVESGHRH